MIAAPYQPRFFRKIENGSLLSARSVVPTLLSLLKPQSIIDVGCGTGAWLAAFREQGIQDTLGIDGDYVDTASLLIPRACFRAANLCQPFELPRRFDLVLSLEVAEHIPASFAEVYLDTLTRLGDMIVFSAAIPEQGGTHHVNEEWPAYWKTRFEKRGYMLVDCLRHRFWNNRDIERWYRQNLLLYVKRERLMVNPLLYQEYEQHKTQALDVVHPATYLSLSFFQLLKMVPRSLARGVRRWWEGGRS